MRSLPAGLAVAILWQVATHAVGAPPDIDPHAVDPIFSTWTADTPGCAVGVSREGKPVLACAYGSADLEHGTPNTPDTVFEAGSVSKQFTAAAILLLAQAGKLKLEDPVTRYLPELPDYGTPITLRHLLHHTSGLRDWEGVVLAAGWPRGTRVHTHAHVLDIMSRQKALNFPPGSEYLYNTGGYNLLAVVVERVSGKSFAQYTKDMIFEPLGMTHSDWRDDFTRVVKGRALAYARRDDGAYHLDMPFENVHGNGGLLTTVGDLLRWNRNFTTERVGGRALVTELQRRGRLNDGLEIAYARGLRVTQFRGLREVGHSGSTAGYRAFLARYPDQALSVAVLCNAAEADTTALTHAVVELYLGDALGAPVDAAPAPVDSARLARWAGLYRNVRTGEPLRLVLEEGALRADRRGPLVPLSEFEFTVAAGQTRLQFRGEDVGRSFDLVGPDGQLVHYAIAQEWKPSVAELAGYEGTYVSDEAEASYIIRVRDGVLFALRRPDARLALTPAYKDAFTASSIPLFLFRRDTRGQINALSLVLGGVRDLRFRRVSSGEAPTGR